MTPARAVAAGVALLAAVAGQAQPVARAPWMTGERLVQLLDRSGQEDATWEDGVFTKTPRGGPIDRTGEEVARGYITGIHDMTEGKAWCWSRYRPAPETLQEQAIWGLRELLPDRRRLNAAYLIVEIWAAKNPCSPARGRRP